MISSLKSKVVIILSIVLALIVGVIVGYIVAPKGQSQLVAPYTEKQFSVTYPQIYRLNIFADEGAIFEGDCKSDVPISAWYTSTGGCAYALGKYGDEPLSVREPTEAIPSLHTYEDSQIPATFGYDLDYIVTKPPYGSRGYYTICFRPYNEGATATIIVRYRVR